MTVSNCFISFVDVIMSSAITVELSGKTKSQHANARCGMRRIFCMKMMRMMILMKWSQILTLTMIICNIPSPKNFSLKFSVTGKC